MKLRQFLCPFYEHLHFTSTMRRNISPVSFTRQLNSAATNYFPRGVSFRPPLIHVVKASVSSGTNIHGKKSILFMDTHLLVTDMKAKGFTEEQATLITNLLEKFSSNLLQEQSSHLVTQAQHEIAIQDLVSQMAVLRKDMIILEKSEFSALKNENEKLKMEMQMSKQSFREEIERVTNTIKLDLNLEKSRAREEHNKVEAEVIKTQNRIDTQVANLKTSFERNRNDMFRYAASVVISCLGICLAFFRLWK